MIKRPVLSRVTHPEIKGAWIYLLPCGHRVERLRNRVYRHIYCEHCEAEWLGRQAA